MYSDLHYKSATETAISINNNYSTYKEVLKSLLDERLEKGEESNKVIERLREQHAIYANKRMSFAKGCVQLFDALITIAIIPITIILCKKFTDSVLWQVIIILAIESLKFYLSSRFDFYTTLQKLLYEIFTKKKKNELHNLDENLALLITVKTEEINNNIWRRKRR